MPIAVQSSRISGPRLSISVGHGDLVSVVKAGGERTSTRLLNPAPRPGSWNHPDPDEYVRIRGDQLRARDGRYELRITNELEEKRKRARFYKITPTGRKQLASEQSKWDAFVRAMGFLLKPGDEEGR